MIGSIYGELVESIASVTQMPIVFTIPIYYDNIYPNMGKDRLNKVSSRSYFPRTKSVPAHCSLAGIDITAEQVPDGHNRCVTKCPLARFGNSIGLQLPVGSESAFVVTFCDGQLVLQ